MKTNPTPTPTETVSDCRYMRSKCCGALTGTTQEFDSPIVRHWCLECGKVLDECKNHVLNPHTEPMVEKWYQWALDELSLQENFRNMNNEQLILKLANSVYDHSVQEAKAERDRVIRLILPMAKGYAYEHPIGSNKKYIEEAEASLKQEVKE